MIVVDASVWVGALVDADLQHADSRRWVADALADGTPIAAPVLVLPEVGGAIARVTGSSVLGRRAVDWLLSLPVLRLVSVDHELGIRAGQLAAEQRLRGADAVYVAVAAGLGRH